MSPALVILAVGSLVAASCALVGTFLVLRRLALLGDAISHAVLPGIAVAVLITGDRAPWLMVLAAGATGVVTVVMVEMFVRTRRLKEDASIGVVFPALFALGVILINRFARDVHIDTDCVLYGEIAYAPWDLLLVAGQAVGPKALWVTGAVFVFDLLLVLLAYKELQLTSFDPGLAAALGFSPVVVHYLLMTAVSVTVVGAFESVGAILVIAMLIVPPAAAYLFTDRLGTMLALGVTLGVAAAWGGYAVASWLDASIAGSMAAVAGAEFLLALLVSPRHGVVARVVRRRRTAARLAVQILLLHLEHAGAAVPLERVRRRFGWSARRLGRVVRRAAGAGWIEASGGAISLTAAGLSEVERHGHAELAHPL